MFRCSAVLFLVASTTMATVVSGAEITSSLEGSSLVWSVDQPHGGAILHLVKPDGNVVTRQMEPEQALRLDLDTAAAQDGQYLYELSLAPVVTDSQRQALRSARDQDQRIETGLSATRISGGFVRQGDQLHVGGVDSSVAEDAADADDGMMLDDGNISEVISGDLTVYNSLCVGFDCLAAENYGSDTIRLKENNLRIHFEDTSTGTFAGGDWRIAINGSQNGDPNFFAVDWVDGGTRPFRIDGGAPNNALWVNSAGNVGVGLPTPVVELHVRDGDTPTLRLEQDTSSGFGAQTWDIAGNETNFFVRDVTNGSLLPFKIRPGASSNSLVIGPTGNVGIGILSPAAKLHVTGGDLRVDGTVYQLSSRAAKTDFVSFDADALLNRLSSLDLASWRYHSQGDGGRHFGPTAEDFFQLFGFGQSDRHISVSDMAGVALGAAQALQQRLDDKDQEIESLEQRLERLERLLDANPNH